MIAPVQRAEPVLIVGAGPAGLATAAMLQRRGIAARILEAGPALGHSWSRYYDRLTLHTGRRVSGLPGYPLPRGYPLYVPRLAYLQYLRAYARRFNLAITPHQRVLRATRVAGLWRLTTADRTWEAPVLVAASGIASAPYIPTFPGLETFGGPALHTSAYHRAAPFAGQRIVLVGLGNSGAEIALDLSTQAAEVTLAVRSGIAIVPRQTFGLSTSYWAVALSYLPSPLVRGMRRALAGPRLRQLRALGLPVGAPTDFPVIGLELLAAIRAGRIRVGGALASVEPGAVRFADGTRYPCDALVLATGFRPALDYLAEYITVPDQKKARLDIRAAPTVPNLYFVGLYYDDLRGTLFTIGRQACAVAWAVKHSGAAHVPDSWVERSVEF